MTVVGQTSNLKMKIGSLVHRTSNGPLLLHALQTVVRPYHAFMRSAFLLSILREVPGVTIFARLASIASRMAADPPLDDMIAIYSFEIMRPRLPTSDPCYLCAALDLPNGFDDGNMRCNMPNGYFEIAPPYKTI